MYDKNAELSFSLEHTYFTYVFFTNLHVSLVTDISLLLMQILLCDNICFLFSALNMYYHWFKSSVV